MSEGQTKETSKETLPLCGSSPSGRPKQNSPKLKGSDRQKMLVNYVKDGTVPEGFYVITTKKGTIQFRRKKECDTDKQIQKLEEKIKKLKENHNSQSASSELCSSSPSGHSPEDKE